MTTEKRAAPTDDAALLSNRADDELVERLEADVRRLAAENAQLREYAGSGLCSRHQLPDPINCAICDSRKIFGRALAECDAALARAEQAAGEARRWAAEQVRTLRRPDTERTGLVWLDQVLVVASAIERGPGKEGE